jgi:hypothetical protein
MEDSTIIMLDRISEIPAMPRQERTAATIDKRAMTDRIFGAKRMFFIYSLLNS